MMASVYHNLFGRAPALAFNFPIGSPNSTFTRKIIPKFLRYSSVSLTNLEKARHEQYIIETDKQQECPSVADIARRSFPILQQKVGDFKMVYLDNAATSQMPCPVFQAQNEYYRNYNSGVHHGIHSLSVEAIDLYELARAKVAYFINAMKPREIVFTRNATEGINLVAYSWGILNLRSGDEVLVTIAEHHSAIVPWQLIAKKTGATLKYVGLTKEEVPDIEHLMKLLSTKTKLVVTHHVSHTLGSVLPLDEIIIRSHDVGAKVLVDACQSVPHMVVDVQKLDADFLVASSHKMCGPTGIGFLYCKSKILSEMDPFIGSNGMIADTFQDQSIFSQPPSRFEAGTPAIAEAVGLAAAIDYLLDIGMQRIHDYEKKLANYLYHSLLSIKHVHVYGPAPSESVHRAALCSFNVEGIHPTEIAKCLYEQHGVAICAGHHCAQPLHRSLGITASARASIRFYTTTKEVDFLCQSLDTTIRFLSSYRYGSPFKCSDDCDTIHCDCFDDF